MGKNDTEDALKKLDRLTQEEARMAAAQLLKVTNTIDNRVEGIANNVLVVDNRVASIHDRVAGVDDRVKDINNKVKAADDKLVAVIDGSPYVLNQFRNCSTLNASRRKRGQEGLPTNS